MNRRQPLFLPAAGGPRQLRIYGGDLVAGLGRAAKLGTAKSGVPMKANLSPLISYTSS